MHSCALAVSPTKIQFWTGGLSSTVRQAKCWLYTSQSWGFSILVYYILNPQSRGYPYVALPLLKLQFLRYEFRSLSPRSRATNLSKVKPIPPSGKLVGILQPKSSRICEVSRAHRISPKWSKGDQTSGLGKSRTWFLSCPVRDHKAHTGLKLYFSEFVRFPLLKMKRFSTYLKLCVQDFGPEVYRNTP